MKTEKFNLALLPIKIEYVAEVVHDGEWRCDQWRVTISNKSGSWNTDYFTGLGHRKINKWNQLVPVKPDVLGVLHSLFLDARSADQNFIDWCADFGYSDDSMKAFSMYRQCCETAVQLRKYFDPEARAHIEQLIEDY